MRHLAWIAFLWTCTTLASSTTPVDSLIESINHAKQSIAINMYSWSNLKPRRPSGPVEASLLRAKQRGVLIHIILNQTPPTQRSHYEQKREDQEMRWCHHHRLSCTWSSGAFCHSHAKSLVIDRRQAVIMTGNLPWRDQSTVNQLIISHDPSVVRYLSTLFQVDLDNARHQRKITPTPIPKQLLISPVNSEDRITGLIRSAKHSLAIEQPFLDNHHRIPNTILRALESALKRHVNIKILTSLTHGTINTSLRQLAERYSHMQIHAVKRPFIHSKSMLIDTQRLLIGSINWSWSSLHCNREIALITKNQRAIRQWRRSFNRLWGQQATEKLVSS